MCAGLDFSQLIVSSLQASLNEFGKPWYQFATLWHGLSK
jgi:hypothetical protein